MKKTKFLCCIFITLIFSILSLTGCSNNSKKITVAVSSDDFFPWSYYEADLNKTGEIGEPKGFDIDLIKEIAQKNNYILEFKIIEFDKLLESVKNNETDIAISALSTTDKRKEIVNFSDLYYEDNGIVILTNKDSTLSENDNSSELIKSMQGKNIGVLKGSSAKVFASSLTTAITETSEISIGIDELINKEIDLYLTDYSNAITVYEKNKDNIKLIDTPFTDEKYGIAINKSNASLLEDINKALSELKIEGKLQELYDKYGIIK